MLDYVGITYPLSIENGVSLALADLSQTTTDRRHIITIAELCNRPTIATFG